MSKLKRVITMLLCTIPIAAPASSAYAASAVEDNGRGYAQYTDAEMRREIESGTYVDPDGNVHAVETTTGTVVVGNDSHVLTSNKTQYNFGSSYASTEDVTEFFYKGTAYASGVKDYYPSSSANPRRVMQVCFHYARNGKDVTNWACSNVATTKPGEVVTDYVRDSLDPRSDAPKTEFHYIINTSKS